MFHIKRLPVLGKSIYLNVNLFYKFKGINLSLKKIISAEKVSKSQ